MSKPLNVQIITRVRPLIEDKERWYRGALANFICAGVSSPRDAYARYTCRVWSPSLRHPLQASGLDQADPDRRPRLLSDNGPSYVAGDLSDWLEGQGMRHTRGKPYHPMTQGKIERWHLSLKSRILLENYYLPGDLEQAVADFVEHYNHRRYHESLDNLTPADVYFGRGDRIRKRRDEIKWRTIEHRRRQHFNAAP